MEPRKRTPVKEERPILEMELKLTDRLLEAFTILCILFIWGIALVNYNTLPHTIPSHVNAAGEIDGFSNKAMLFFIPAVITIMSIGMLMLSRFPHKFNYPLKVTLETAPRVYTFSSRMVRVLAIGSAVLFTIIEVLIISMAKGKTSGSLFAVLITLILVLTIFYLIYSISKLFQLGKTQ